MFNGIFYNLDAQTHRDYVYNSIDELYQFYEEIGEGSFSKVYRAKFVPNNQIMAVKVLKKEKATD